MARQPIDHVHHNLQNGRVVISEAPPRGQRRKHATARGDWVIVDGAVPVVSRAGWVRSRTASSVGGPKRSVHAWVHGRVVEYGAGCPPIPPHAGNMITYNPSRSVAGAVPVFHWVSTGEEWTGSDRVLITGGKVYAL